VSDAPEFTPSAAAPPSPIIPLSRRCACEIRDCKVGHPFRDCRFEAKVKASHGAICSGCAQCLPAPFLFREALAYTEEPWVSRVSRDQSVLILHQPLLSSNDVIACVMHHRDGSTPANAKLFLHAPRLLRALSKLQDACADLDSRQSKELFQAMLEAGELLAEMEARP
jgi:hypothetical protein